TAFPDDAVLRQVINGKRPMPADPELQLVYSVNSARLQQQDAGKNNATTDANVSSSTSPSPQDQARAIAERLLTLPKEQRLTSLTTVPPERSLWIALSLELVNFPNLIRPDQRDRLFSDATPHEREIIRAFVNGPNVVVSELQEAKILRETYTERQLQE